MAAHRPGSSPLNKSTLEVPSFICRASLACFSRLNESAFRAVNLQQCRCHVGFFGDFLCGFFFNGKFRGFFGSDDHVSILRTDRSGSFSRFLLSARQLVTSNSSGRSKPNKTSVTASGNVPSSTCSSSFPINSSPRFAAEPSAGNIVVPLFVSTYCTLGNSSLSHPSLFGSHGASSGALPATIQFFSLAFSAPTFAHSVASLLHKPFIVGPGYSPIPEKLVTKIKAGQFIDLADLQGPGFQAPNVLGWETACVFQEEGTRNYRYRNMGGSLYSVYVDLLLFSPI